MLAQVEREIAELHVFFESWLGGTGPETSEALRRFDDVVAPEFHIVTPQGRIVARTELLDQLRKTHGARPQLHIEIRDVRVLDVREDTCLATYEEWQRTPAGSDKGRVSSVLFRRAPERINGLVWLHVHETWIEAG